MLPKKGYRSGRKNTFLEDNYFLFVLPLDGLIMKAPGLQSFELKKNHQLFRSSLSSICLDLVILLPQKNKTNVLGHGRIPDSLEHTDTLAFNKVEQCRDPTLKAKQTRIYHTIMMAMEVTHLTFSMFLACCYIPYKCHHINLQHNPMKFTNLFTYSFICSTLLSAYHQVLMKQRRLKPSSYFKQLTM